MKKVIFVLILFLSCYVIYHLTDNNSVYYLSIGDFLSEGINNNGTKIKGYSYQVKELLEQKKMLEGYNNIYSSKEYRISDFIKILEYNESIKVDNKLVTLNQLLKKADILTISLGTTELYYKLLINDSNIYEYINNMIDDIDYLLLKINKYSYSRVFFLGYYNITKENKDLFNYANYELKKILKKYNYEYIDLSQIFDYNPAYFENNSNFYPNNAGYEKISQIIIEKISKN